MYVDVRVLTDSTPLQLLQKYGTLNYVDVLRYAKMIFPSKRKSWSGLFASYFLIITKRKFIISAINPFIGRAHKLKYDACLSVSLLSDGYFRRMLPMKIAFILVVCHVPPVYPEHFPEHQLRPREQT